nr:MAG TPA: deoxycytidylate deaminase [Caudoviricetes sp.]
MKEIFDRQRYLMEEVYKLSPEAMIDHYRITSLALVDEVMEALHHVPWKPWSKRTMWGWEELQGELVDVFTLLVQLCILAGVGPEDLRRGYFDKSKINECRQESGMYGADSPASKLSQRQIDALFEMAELGECTADKVGCLIVAPDGQEVYGYNKSVDGMPCDHKPSDGCPGRTVHAEISALAESVRVGVPVAGGCAFVTSPSCDRCAETLKAAGIIGVWKI